VKMWQRGYRPVVGILGSHPGEAQVEMLVRDYERIVVVPDGDAAGRDFGVIVKRMVASRIPVVAVDTPAGRDPGDLSESELLELLGMPSDGVE
jgi:DNA primase